MTEARVIIAGSRKFTDYSLLNFYATKVIDKIDTHRYSIRIISGGANGADKLCEKFANEKGYDVARFIPDWGHAGYVRNAQMARYASEYDNYGILIAFWDGKSRGTKYMINLAKKYNLEIHVVNYENCTYFSTNLKEIC